MYNTVPEFLDVTKDSPQQVVAGQMQPRVFVPYMDLGDGLNTKDDAHAILRSQLAVSVNCWYGSRRALQMRPGNNPFVSTTGATGAGRGGNGLFPCRFNGVTYFLVQQGTALYFAKATDTTWTAIVTAMGAGAGPISCAQMFDPSTDKDSVFICNGVDTPWIWTGPTTTALVAATVPKNASNTANITPKYCATLGNNSKLFYANDPSAPSAVYISDAEYPQSFTTSLTASSWYAGTYFPALIGQNDGVEGGSITGIFGLGSSMIVYKESAVYRMTETQLLGDTAFIVSIVSSSRGAQSPKSVIKFESFHVFLSIDGVWMTQGNENDLVQISADVPTYFDATLSGFAATCQNYTTAQAGRMGNRYLIWFDDGSGSPVRGLWFDFNKPNPNSGLPSVGEISNMNMGGCCTADSSGDDGHLIWIDAGQDRVGHFGLGFSDFGGAIIMTFYGKADMMDDVFGQTSPLDVKFVDNVQALLALPALQSGESITVTCSIVTDLLNNIVATNSFVAPAAAAGGTWGQNWAPSGSNQMNWATLSSSAYATLDFSGQDLPNSYGRVLQIGFQVSSTFPITFLGYIVEVNRQEPPR